MPGQNHLQQTAAARVGEPSELSHISPEVSEAIKGLSPEQRQIVIQSIQAVRQESFSGPIPHPELLKGYESVKQGFAERIVSMAEEQQKHRFECENKMVEGTVSESKRGQWMAFIVAIIFVVAAVALGLYGHDWLAGVIGGGTLVALVTVFVTGRRSQSKDKRSRDEGEG